jgi:tRNA(Ile)-lysidine synthase
MLKKVKEAVRRYRLIEPGEKIVVGVSGGPDSVALLYCLYALSRQLRLNLHVAHLDHGLRRGSVADARFVQALAVKLNLPFSSARARISRRGSIEEAARQARLDFFFRVAKKIKAKKIALGHNLDDQAETVLMRVLRGSGLLGLSSILPKREILGFTVIRPLLEVRRKDIEAYLKRKKIRPRRDISNSWDIYLRNKIRNRLLPLLEKDYNPGIRQALKNLAESAACDYAYLLAVARKSKAQLGRRISLKKLSKLPPALQRLVFRLNIAALKGNTRRLSLQHIREIEDLVARRPVGSIVDLPQGVSALKRKKTLVFFRKKAQ